MINTNINVANSNIEQFKKNGKEILDNSEKILLNANVPIPVGKKTSEDKTEKPMVGLQVEHTEEVNNVTADKTSNKKNDVLTYKYKRNNFNDASSTLNSSYRKFSTHDAGNSFPGADSSDNNKINDSMVDTLDEIDNKGKGNIIDLNADLPEGGLFNANASYTYESSEDSKTSTYFLNVNNSWQNKKKTFGLITSATAGYDQTITAADQNNEGNLSLNLSANARYNHEKFKVGAKVESTFYENKDQITDISLTGIDKKTKIGADITRTTMVTHDKEGNKVAKHKLKIKFDLLSNKPGENEEYPHEDPIKPHDITLPSESNSDIQEANAQIKKFENLSHKDGSGFDVDFEYDNLKCGFIGEYGLNVINNPEKGTRLTVAPALGLYYHSTNDDSTEAAQITFGSNIRFRKKWADEQTLKADLSVMDNRVVETGCRPIDGFYSVVSGEYKNPRAKLSVNAEAGYIKSHPASVTYAEARVGYQIKHMNIGLKGGFSNIVDGSENHEKNLQFAGSVIYILPY